MDSKPAKKIRVLVVDDSAFMRKAISKMLEVDPDIEVVGTARDGEEGIAKTRALRPDLVTMDIEMPRMDGLTALRHIMSDFPTPVMMVSSITTEGAQATLDALDLGAVDFIPKGMSFVSLDIVNIQYELRSKIKAIARRKHLLMSRYRSRLISSKANQLTSGTTAASTPTRSLHTVLPKRRHPVGIVAVGCSTGGPPALQTLIPKLPRNFPVGVIISQHMPPRFTESLAQRLNQLSLLSVKEAADGDYVEPGTVLIAPGGRQMTVKKVGSRGQVTISDEPSNSLYKPCVDVTINSVAQHYGRSSMGVILTGMGNNGVVGMGNIKRSGGIVIAQDEESCVVYGMPRAVIEASLADHITPLDFISDEILSYF